MERKLFKNGMLSLACFCMKGFTPTLLICGIFFSAGISFTFAHGTVTFPPSRIWTCYQENPENPTSAPCISAVATHGTQALYDWNEISQGRANGNHLSYVLDGNLASGGRPDKYGGMDQVRSDWVATPVSAGPFTVTWTVSAPHATAYYDIYITKEDWTPAQPLTWDNLIRLIRTAPSSAASTVDIPITLPARTGKHVIYSIWQRSDSPEAFYSTSDIDFGTGTTSIDPNVRENYKLNPNLPNPFNSTTLIGYKLGKGEYVSLKVYDISGREMATLVEGFQASGDYELTFDRGDLPSGIYFYRLQAGAFIETKRMVLQR